MVTGAPLNARSARSKSCSTHPPAGDDGMQVDSILAENRETGGCDDLLEVMLYNESRLLPVAIVSYMHVSDCVCNLCH